MTCTTSTEDRVGGDLRVAPDGWDHVTVTQGATGRPRPTRSVVLTIGALVAVAAVGLGAAAVAPPPVAPARSRSAATSAPQVHSRFGPVVHADPTSHSRLGPVVRHGALPRQWKS
jgi:hypothetical protein